MSPRHLLFLFISCGSLLHAEPAKRIDASTFPTLQAALDALQDTGGIVTLPPGNYELTEPLVIKTAETRIEGSGASTHLINKNEEGKPAISIRPPTLDADKKAELWRVQIGNLRISGNPKSGDGIYAEKIQEIFLQGVSIDHHGANGVHLNNCFEDPRVNDCIFTYNALAGLQITGCHDIVVNGNHFEENQDALRCVDAFNLCANGNNIDDHLRHGIVIENTYGSVCSGNMIEECNGTAIILDRDCYGITLSANVIAHHVGGGIDLIDANGCALSANTFVLCHGFSVRLSEESGRNSLSGNAFCNTYIGNGQLKRTIREHKNPMQIDTGAGIVIEGASDLAITGNTFTGLDTEAVKADSGSQRLMIANNILTECGRRLAAAAKWLAVDEAKDSIIKDNLGAK